MGKNTSYLILCMLVVAVIGAAIIPPASHTGKINIGAPDDSGGMIVHYLINQKGLTGVEVNSSFDLYPLKDCCTSTTQYAMSTDLLDLAVMCPDAARVLLEKDDRFAIVGPLLVNSDLIVLKPGRVPKKIGVTQNRYYQEQIIAEKFGPNCSAVPMMTVSLPYALEKNAVDGVIVDVLKGLWLQGDKLSTVAAGGDRVTYVLVVRKSFRESPAFQRFIELIDQAADELNRPEILRQAINSYNNLDLTREEVKKWSQLGIKFVSITPITSG